MKVVENNQPRRIFVMKQKNTAISDTQSKNIAIRLKMLREEKGISHETLSSATGISKDTLIKYEKTDEYNTSFGANKGMRIDFAVSLANYYNTSTDYILCNTDIKSPDLTINDICDKTGLTENAVIRLIKLKRFRLQECNTESRFYSDESTATYRCINAINDLLEKNNGIDILCCIANYLYRTHNDGYEEYPNGSRRIINAEDLNDTDLYLKIMPQIKAFQKELMESENNVSIQK